MKFLKLALTTAICLAVIFSACKKEDVFTDRQSYGSLIDSSGECLPKSVEGIYKEATPLAVDNFIDVHVIVDSVGAYEIKTDSLNGYSFKGTGTFGIKGDNLVRLYGHGSPDLPETDIFTVSYGSTSCSIAVKVIPAPHADFILDTTAGGCPGTKTEGTLSTNIAATPANKATLAVLVTKPGVYNIKLVAQNGITYQAKGVFAATGAQTINFIASGTPIVSGDFNYEAKVNGTSCIYSVHVVEGPVPPTSTTAVFTLGGSPSVCTGFILGGTYTTGTALTNSNTVTCDVNVTTVGTYSISTNVVNGIFFNTTGTFTSTGSQTIVLRGTGTPTSAVTSTYKVSAGVNNCTFDINVNGGTSGTTGNYFLSSLDFADCRNGSSFRGNFIAGKAFTSTELMHVEVIVSTAGTYVFYTDTVNGVYFRKTGTFTTTGPQTIIVPGFGTPLTTGEFNFEMFVKENTDHSCTTSVCWFGNGATPASGDYFPLSTNSWWSYTGNANSQDVYKKSETSTTIAGNTYQQFYIGRTASDQIMNNYYRKSGQDVYEYMKVDSLTGIKFNTPQFADILMLKQNAKAGDSWESPVFTGAYGGSSDIGSLVYLFQVESVGGTLTVNGNTYTDVTKVRWGGYQHAGSLSGYLLYSYNVNYYAKGVGLIKRDIDIASQELQSYQVF